MVRVHSFEYISSTVQAMSARIDAEPRNQENTPLENLLLRTTVKLAEEYGELNEAIIGVTGQNPRKGETHTWDDVDKELMDIAVAALGAYEHRHNNDGSSIKRLAAHLEGVRLRQMEYDRDVEKELDKFPLREVFVHGDGSVSTVTSNQNGTSSTREES
jgi:NTP pyrophosphatase (non-canonical NTP hydrolase)